MFSLNVIIYSMLGYLSTSILATSLTSSPIISLNSTAIQAINALPISKSLGSLSIEFCYITDYLGNVSHPNNLTLNLLRNIQDLLGNPPIIRIGGDTQDAASYNPSNPSPLTNIFVPGNLEAVNVTFNAELFQILNENVLPTQQFIFGLNFASDNLDLATAEILAAEKFLDPKRLYAYELGNEPDFYSTTRRPLPWNVDIYVEQQVDWITSFKSQLTARNSSIGFQGFQIGALAQEPIFMGNFSLVEISILGLPEMLSGDLKSFSDHTYPFSVCTDATAALVSLPNLMNHMDTIQYFSQWQAEIAATKALGIPFHMGETGSVSCHGKDGVSNTLGAALWEIDYMLHGATLGMEGVYFHMGTPFFYSMWQPTTYNSTPPTVYPTYLSLLFHANLLTNIPTPSILELSAFSSDSLAIYAVFNSSTSNRNSNGPLSGIAILNLAFYNDTGMERPTQLVDMKSVFGGAELEVLRLTGNLSTTTSIEDVRWVGQSYSSGIAEGVRVTEEIENGIVSIAASEAIIIQQK